MILPNYQVTYLYLFVLYPAQFVNVIFKIQNKADGNDATISIYNAPVRCHISVNALVPLPLISQRVVGYHKINALIPRLYFISWWGQMDNE